MSLMSLKTIIQNPQFLYKKLNDFSKKESVLSSDIHLSWCKAIDKIEISISDTSKSKLKCITKFTIVTKLYKIIWTSDDGQKERNDVLVLFAFHVKLFYGVYIRSTKSTTEYLHFIIDVCTYSRACTMYHLLNEKRVTVMSGQMDFDVQIANIC